MNKKEGAILILTVLALGIFLSSPVLAGQIVDLNPNFWDYFIEAIKGNVPGTTSLNKFGENLAVGTSLEDIQSQGGKLTFLTSAEKINITSSSGGDTLAGAGARKVFIQGLDSDFNKISETVNLNGASVSQTTQEFIRIYRMYVTEVGGYGVTNLGTITGTAEVNATTQIEIAIGLGQSQTTHYTVPNGKGVIIKYISITEDTGKVIDVFMRSRPLANNTASAMAPIKTLETWRGLDAPIQIESFANKLIDEKSDIWFEALVSTGTAEVEINFDIIEYEK